MRIFRLSILVIAVLTSLATPETGRAQDGQVLDEIVAVVGDYIILKSDVDGYVINAMSQQRIPYSTELWMAAVNQLVNEKIFVIHALRDTNLVVSEQAVEMELDSRIQRMSAEFGGEAQLEQRTGQSVIELKSDQREIVRDQMLAETFQRGKIREIKATPSDVREWFQRIPTDSLPTLPEIVRLSHIVRKPKITDEARAEAMEIMSTIRDTVLTGAVTIEQMAELFSDDPGSAERGGLDEGTSLSELVPEFAAVASRVPIGLISQIFETKFGLHILRVNARRGDVIDYNHVLVAFDERKNDPAPAIEILTQLRDSVLTAGASFEVLARDNSQEEPSASMGGRITDPSTGERNLFLENLGGRWQATIIPLAEGEISEPREADLLDGTVAYHIVRLDRRIPPHVVNLLDDYPLLESLALREKQALVMSDWITNLRKDVYIDMRGSARDLSIADQ